MLVAERYRLDEPLGRGGMGEVWRAADQVLGRAVAVKLMLPGEADAEAAGRFRLEAQTAARLNHPHVVGVYDFGAHAGQFYLVMELVNGHSLAQELATHGSVDSLRASEIGAQAAAGLAAAHRQGVIHRDIKPANVMLTTDGSVKIADFGIARFTDEASRALTATGRVMGSSGYLAPERALGRPAEPASDVYALGCVLYELLTGRPPFVGESALAVIHQHVDAAPVPVRQLNPAVPGALADYILSLLAKEPGQRPTAEQIAGWLAVSAGQNDKPQAAMPAGTEPTPTAVLPDAAPSRLYGRGAAQQRRIRILIGVAVVAVFGTAAAVGAAWSSDDGGSSSPGPASSPSSVVTAPSVPSGEVSTPVTVSSPSSQTPSGPRGKGEDHKGKDHKKHGHDD
ncbi:serine/threonine-protein kinase [Streptomyces sp. NPDC002574]|uniref:serine/threonine-protein kinase n=1 Tax=Streptomyces sp. NPDC002574 TaxID=3364652 RepID=UPI0036C24DCE